MKAKSKKKPLKKKAAKRKKPKYPQFVAPLPKDVEPGTPADPPPISRHGRESDFTPDMIPIAEMACSLGATDFELAERLGVSDRTIRRWKVEHEPFALAMKVGKDFADGLVVRALYNRARGYSYESEEIFHFEGTITRAECRVHVAPDTTAAIFWLKNRDPEHWRDRKELTGKNGEPLQAAAPILNVIVSSDASESDRSGSAPEAEPGVPIIRN